MKNLLLTCGIALVPAAFLAQPVFAQDGYFFGSPRVSVSLHAGAAQPHAGGELFQFMTSELTLDRGDFKTATFGGDIAVRILPQLDGTIAVSSGRSRKQSEFRDWLDENDQPITQVTKLQRTPLTLGLKYYPLARGRSLGRYAWVPARVSPYVGASGGVVWYSLRQDGEFVDHNTLDIFGDYFRESGVAATGHAVAGAEMWVISRLALNAEARYAWGSATLTNDFSDFGKIDLGGWQITTGLTVRF